MALVRVFDAEIYHREERFKNKMKAEFLKTLFEMFDRRVKHCNECLRYWLKRSSILDEVRYKTED